MPIIKIAFKRYPVLDLAITDSVVGQQYYQLVKENYNQAQPIFRDRKNYDFNQMVDLAHQAKQVLGWDWVRDSYDTSTAIILHKNIEQALAHGFDSIPAEHDHLLHELHYCLHVIQGHPTLDRKGWLQIEWYNDCGFQLDDAFKFSTKMEIGDIKLQNPYVGHPPQTIFEEQDNINISQTCKFHDFVKPGVNIVVEKYKQVNKIKVLEYFNQHAPDFVKTNGEEKIQHYTGYPVVGRVLNVSDLVKISVAKTLELDYMDFIDE